jgi:hypothetical protein
VQHDGTLRLHLQYIPSSQLDVSGDFDLQPSATGVPAPVSDFMFRLAGQLEVVDGAHAQLGRTTPPLPSCAPLIIRSRIRLT